MPSLFSGVVQAEEHSRSKCHQDAVQSFTEQKQPPKVASKFSHTGEDNYKEYRTLFQGFFKLGKTSGSDSKAQEIDQKFEKVCCCYLWDPEVVKHFAKDDSIRKLTAKMLF